MSKELYENIKPFSVFKNPDGTIAVVMLNREHYDIFENLYTTQNGTIELQLL